jgi:hypothetical protein
VPERITLGQAREVAILLLRSSFRHELVGYGAVDEAVIVAEREVDHGTDGDGVVPFLSVTTSGIFVMPPTPMMAELG